jgi:hypothetical protein
LGTLVKALIELLALATTSFWVTAVAAFQFVLPGCAAVIVVVPAPTIVRVLLRIEATPATEEV